MTCPTETSGPAANDMVPLGNLTHADRERVGPKAANLAELARAGFPVPAGVVVTSAAFQRFLAAHGFQPDSPHEAVASAPLPPDSAAALRAAAAALGPVPLAVRSSACAEDLPDASFAGQYESVLDVRGAEELEAAVRTCWASAFSGRAAAYRAGRGQDAAVTMAVLVQRMVRADAAGVALTANPLTGDRDEIVVTAVQGPGGRLVSGEAPADEWVVRGTVATCRRSADGALSSAQVRAVAGLARRIQEHVGSPQDVEWAIVGDQLCVLQARPMTALPEPVEWTAPLPGGWLRNFRLGEWLPEPVTPLFDSWLLARVEGRFASDCERDCGFLPPPPPHVVVHGWYFYSPLGTGSPLLILRGMLRRPRFGLAGALTQIRPDLSDRLFVARLTRTWREELLPRYQALVEAGQQRVADASPDELIHWVDQVADLAGAYLWSISMVSGYAWKVEGTLAKFYRTYLRERVGRSHQELLCGLSAPTPEPPAHAVQSLDWVRPTLGELAPIAARLSDVETRRARLHVDRLAAEAACREALAARPTRLKRFETLLALARRYAVLREEQVVWFTLGWPLLRRAVLRLGDDLCQHGVIGQADDVFFLTRAELEASRGGQPPDGIRAVVAARRRDWERQRRLSPPLMLGTLPTFMTTMLIGTVEAMRIPGSADPAAVRGMPASPGRATGPVHVIRGHDDVARFQADEVLVSAVVTPAWTPLFARAAAVVADGGTVAAHASLIAREYGIPAVVGTGDATTRLHDGQIVTVDGSAGIVEVHA